MSLSPSLSSSPSPEQAAWLRLTAHQSASELGGAVGGARRQGAIDAKRLAVLRRAVARVPQSERLRRALLTEAEVHVM